ncbi:MAG: amidase, partial [Bacteroidetes bacterium]|nr:amidase [Bacteroidota bacterium]
MKETTIKQRTHVFTDDVLSDLDGVALAKLIKNKELHPSEVVAAAIERAKKADQEINAVVTECYDKAIKTADQPVKGFFGGIPTFIKD